MHDVVQNRHLEQTEQPGVGLVAGERQIAEIGGDTGNEAQHTDEQKDDADDGGGLLYVVRGPRAVVVRSDMTVRLLGTVCYRLFVAAAVWLATLWAYGYLPRLVSFFNMPVSTATGRCCSPA